MLGTKGLCLFLSIVMVLMIPSAGFARPEAAAAETPSSQTPCVIVHAGQQPTASDQELLASRMQQMEQDEAQMTAGTDRRTVYIVAGVVVVVVVAGVVVAMMAYSISHLGD